MAIKVVTNWYTLMEKARAVAKAKKTGNKEEIEAAETDHENYRQLCLEADEMIIPRIP